MTSVEIVKSICKSKKIAISRLEKDLGYGNGYIGQLKKGVFPHDRLFEIAEYLGVSVSELLGKEEQKRPTPEARDGLTEFVTIVDRIRTLCEENGITINKLEQAVGIGRGNIARWDKHKPAIEKVAKVADFFGVSIGDLFNGEQKKPTTETGDGLTELQSEAWEIMKKMSVSQLKTFIVTYKALAE